MLSCKLIMDHTHNHRSVGSSIRTDGVQDAQKPPALWGGVTLPSVLVQPRADLPAPQYGIAKAKYLGLQPDRADARSHQVDRLPPALPGAVQIADGLAAKVMRRADLNSAADLSSSAVCRFFAHSFCNARAQKCLESCPTVEVVKETQKNGGVTWG